MHDEWFTHINCSLCGEWEMFPASMPLRKAQCFCFLRLDDVALMEWSTGVYQCHCGHICTSWYTEVSIED